MAFHLKVAPNSEISDPNDFVPAGYHRPALLHFARDVTVLQQLLNFLGPLAICGPEAIAGTPVADKKSFGSELFAQ
jgi:hypothetical protein